MLDIRLIRTEPERVKTELAKVGFPAAEVDALLAADRRRREAVHALEALRAERTSSSKAIRTIADPAERERAIATQRAAGERIAAAERAVAAAEEEFDRRMLEVPNLPDPDVPVGPDESANVVLRTEGELPRFDLVIVDEGHNLKHGFGEHVAARNRVLALAMGHPSDDADEKLFPGFGSRAQRVLFLSATPVEETYRQLWNQLDVFGRAGPFNGLRSSDLDEDAKKGIARQFLVRRVTSARPSILPFLRGPPHFEQSEASVF